MNELIKITEQNGQQSVSARELHMFLENTDNVNTWFQIQSDRAMLEYNKDYLVCEIATQVPHQGGVRNQIIKDYALTLSSAKEIAMLNGGDKGKQARLYFIECENKLKLQLPSTYKDAILALGESLVREEQLQLKANTLEVKLDVLLDWVSIIKIAKHNNIKETEFNCRVLKSASKKLGYEIKRSESPRFGYQNLYHINAFKSAYPQYNYNIKD